MIKKLAAALVLVAAVSCGRTITVENTLDFDRAEMVEVEAPAAGVRLLDASSREIPYQITYDRKLIFQASVKAGSKAQYRLVRGKPSPVDTIATGEWRPDRKDDVIWENDRSGYRIYGPALEASGERAYGYDVFTKSVPHPVMSARFNLALDPTKKAAIKELRAQGLREKADSLSKAISFHVDHGDGMDVYPVGPTLGCGTAAPLAPDGTILYPRCWQTHRILDNGPLRFTLEVTMSGGTETRIITCDAGAWLNKVQLTYTGLPEGAPVAAGIVIHDSAPDAYFSGEGYIGYAEPGSPNPGENGEIYCGVVMPHSRGAEVSQGHILLQGGYREGFTYWFGSAWSRADVASAGAWEAILRREVLAKGHPLRVTK